MVEKKSAKPAAKKGATSTKSAAPKADDRSEGKSRKVIKIAAKAKARALKNASKSKVRLSRAALRAAKNAEKSGKGAKQGKRLPTIGQAPHSARISAIKGPIQAPVARTQFVPKYSKDRQWLLVDANGQTVGRLASEIAMLLRGKHKPSFTPNNDAGDFVVVINANNIKFGNPTKEDTKIYYKHSGYISGLKEHTPSDFRNKNQAFNILFKAVRGMVPRSPLGRAQMTKLKIYNEAKHPHSAQRPVVWKLRHSV